MDISWYRESPFRQNITPARAVVLVPRNSPGPYDGKMPLPQEGMNSVRRLWSVETMFEVCHHRKTQAESPLLARIVLI
jgi:hypothetical protein